MSILDRPEPKNIDLELIEKTGELNRLKVEIEEHEERLSLLECITRARPNELYVIKQGKHILPTCFTDIQEAIGYIFNVADETPGVNFATKISRDSNLLQLRAKGQGKVHSHTMTIIPVFKNDIQIALDRIDFSGPVISLAKAKEEKEQKEYTVQGYMRKHKIKYNDELGSITAYDIEMPWDADVPEEGKLLQSVDGLKVILKRLQDYAAKQHKYIEIDY